MKSLIALLVVGCLAVVGLFGGAYVYWHRQEIQHGQVATYTNLYAPKASHIAAEYLKAEPRRKIKWAQLEVGEKLKLDQYPSTREKIAAITDHLLTEVQPFMGIPQEEGTTLSGLELYEAMLEGRASIWGDNLNRVYVALASALGIPTRMVEVGNSERVTTLAGHRFAESFLAEEGRWAFVDVSSRKAYVLGPAGLPLNAVELFDVLHTRGEDQLEVALYQGGEVAIHPYGPHAAPEQHHFQIGHSLCYPRAPHLYGSKVRRLSYELLSPKRVFPLIEEIKIAFESP